MTRLARICAVLVMLATFGAACAAIPVDSAPRQVAEEHLVEELLPGSTPAVATRVAVTFIPDAFSIYLIGEDGKLVAVPRELPVNSDAEDVIRVLIMGPTPAEAARNLTTALAVEIDDAIISVENSQAGTVVLNVEAGPLESLSTAELRVAIAQIVFTVSDLLAVSSFRLQVGGNNSVLPTDADDSTPEEPVDRNDYRSLDPSFAEPTPG